MLTSFARCPMSGVLRPEAGDHLVVAGVAPQREGRLEYVVAGLHQHEDTPDLLLSLLGAEP